ncbi:hypothetical protein GOP47_0003206 [Adiantum capillus-veneris]|uniref:Uncharacterized protein n=1 Tax=Adiantum capillus-veneris TaxID=13818 RepID=A0A9D4VDA7_ADICA|nr:hypothetical protein GOP47_0003206 [Adiantum capillus-veneris]
MKDTMEDVWVEESDALHGTHEFVDTQELNTLLYCTYQIERNLVAINANLTMLMKLINNFMMQMAKDRLQNHVAANQGNDGMTTPSKYLLVGQDT